MRLYLWVLCGLFLAPAYGQTLPTATEAFNLRIKCKDMVGEKTQTMTEEFYRKNAPELDFFFSSSRYDPRANRCYGEFHYKQKFHTGPLKEREVHVLYDMQVDDLIAIEETKDGKKYGVVYDHSHNKTTNANAGWDDTDAYMNDLIEDKK